MTLSSSAVTIDTLIAAIADFERLPVPGGVFDLDGTILAANEAAVKLLGRPAAELVGRKGWEFAPGAEHIWAHVVAMARTAPFHGAISIATPTGPRAIHYVVSQRAHGGRTVVLLFAVEVATTEDDDRAHRVESLGRVAGGIAHDFNNQLVSVLAEASSAREDATLSQGVRDSLRRIEAAAQRMAHLTRQLLSYAGRGRFVTQPIAPDVLLHEIQEQLARSVRPDAELTLQATAASATIEADRNMLREVIVNLVVNASEALSPNGGKIRVATSIQPRDGTGYWRLEVTDDGAGMDSHTVARMFDPFFTTKTDHHGLGLSAVHGIVRRLAGEISVESKPSVGTSIVVVIPIATGKRAQTKDTPSAPYRAAALRGLTILVADDESSVRSTIRRLLERRGATVVVAGDGAEAEARLRENTFSLVLLDVMMPKLTGYQLLPIVRETQPSARVLLMSGFTDVARATGSEDEADAFLEKPFTAKQMDDAIDALLETK